MAELLAVAAIMSIERKKNQVMPEKTLSEKQRTTEDASCIRDLIYFNISGQSFTISGGLTSKYPTSRLANKESLRDFWSDELNAYYFDRDPSLFNAVLNIFRYNVLSVPCGYDRALVTEEVEYWGVQYKPDLSHDEQSEEQRLENEFLQMENRISPPKPDASSFKKWRYQAWCFITDPYGPHTEYRKLSLAYSFLSMAAVLFYLILVGMSTSVYYQQPISSSQSQVEKAAQNAHTSESNFTSPLNMRSGVTTDQSTTDNPGTTHIPSGSNIKDMDRVVISLGCKGVDKLSCFLQTQTAQWIQIPLSIIAVFFSLETIVRLALCPGSAYFKSIITWIDIFTTSCILSALVLIFALTPDQRKSRSAETMTVLFDSLQVLRVFKVFQYANVIDGLMVMMLTIRASIKELLLLVLYLLMAMFLFATLISFTELRTETGTGIPDALHGYWWAIITKTTVGYGDYYPTTTVGYMIGICCAITGIIMTALPVAVVGSHFNLYWEHNKKRKAALMKASEREEYSADQAVKQECDRLKIETLE